MKKIGFIIFIFALIVGVVLANTTSFGKFTGKIFSFSINRSITGSGNTATENRDVASFRSINTGGVFQVEVATGTDFSLELEADDNLLPLIKTEVRGGALHLETEKGVNSKNPILVRITAPDIENLDVSGASQVSLENISNENLIIDAGGASKVTVAGESANLTIDASGASKIAAENLKAQNVSVDAGGAVSVEVFALNELKADASGASNIIYRGSPKNLIKKTSGASFVKQK